MLWLAGEHLKEEFQKWHKHTNRQINLIDCWTASFAVKNWKCFKDIPDRPIEVPGYKWVHDTVKTHSWHIDDIFITNYTKYTYTYI